MFLLLGMAQLLSDRLVETLKRVVLKESDRQTSNASLSQFVRDYGLGREVGKSVYFKESERIKIRELLTSQGYSFDKIDLTKMSRFERLMHTPNEKSGSGNVKRDRISIKHLSGKAIEIAGEQSISLPPESHLDINRLSIQDWCRNDSVMLVENYENFNLIHKARFCLPSQYASPLVIYRGDKDESSNNTVMHFLKNVDLPVLAYVDIDPAGLVIASKLPRLQGIVAPNLEDLEKLLSSTASKRLDLYDKQYGPYSAFLEKLPPTDPARKLWEIIKKYRAGLVQERFITMNIESTLWPPLVEKIF